MNIRITRTIEDLYAQYEAIYLDDKPRNIITGAEGKGSIEMTLRKGDIMKVNSECLPGKELNIGEHNLGGILTIYCRNPQKGALLTAM